MKLGGFANHVARIDLTSGTIRYEGIREEDARLYVGARGLGVKYLLDNGPTVEPLAPENLLAFVNGPLTGSLATMSGRHAVVTKSPLTGTVTDSHIGGWSAARLRWAGFDALLFVGKAEAPVYAFVENGRVTLRPAADLWGKGVHETVRILTERYRDDVSVLTIGEAGENLVLFASMINEHDRAAGRGGTGAVAGSKGLKAVVVRANKDGMPQPAQPAQWKAVHQRTLRRILDSPITSPRKGSLSRYGTNAMTHPVNVIGGLGTRNSQATQYALAEQISGEQVRETVLVAEPTCHACPVGCKKEVEISEGPHQGLRMGSFEYEPAWSLGSNCDNDDVGVIAKCVDQCNDHGIDAIEVGNVLSMYMEATERGYLDGPGLAWGDGEGMVRMIELIIRREGIGNILADGVSRAAAVFGHPEIAMAVKGQAIAAYDPRALKGEGLGYATSNRGACHLRGYTPASELLGIPVKTDPLEWRGKGELLKNFQDLHAFSDSLDLCKFSAFVEGPEEYAAQYEAIVGIPLTAEEVLTAGERIYNLERYFNNLAGFDGSHDTLPERFLKEPGSGPAANSVCELDAMKVEYYAARGWVNGVVPAEKLRDLQIIR